MKNNLKNALIFTTGMAVGIGICAANIISYIFNDDDSKEVVKKKVTNKIRKTLDRKDDNSDNSESVTIESYKDIRFVTYNMGIAVKEKMQEIMSLYGCVRVSDLCDIANTYLRNTNICIKDTERYGWTNISDCPLKRDDIGYYIVLPEPELLC